MKQAQTPAALIDSVIDTAPVGDPSVAFVRETLPVHANAAARPASNDDISRTVALERRLETLQNIVQNERRLRRMSERQAADLRGRLAANRRPETVDADELTQLVNMVHPSGSGNKLRRRLQQKEQQVKPPAAAPASKSTALCLPIGHRLFEYRIDAVLGQGGFGITYLATDVNLNARVAIKEYLPADFAHRAADQSVFPLWPEDRETYQGGLDSFLIEARTLATFRHPNIVRVARFFETHHTAYAVLEYEDGQPLKTWWPQNHHLPEQELLTLCRPLLDGLAVVHQNGFLHRDIKPDNIYVRREDGSLVLLDFGSARETIADHGHGSNVVTPGYAPAEQYVGGQQGPWTDIYAFGATLYWMITDAKPPAAPTRSAEDDPMTPAVKAGAGRYSEEFLRAIDWALHPEPARRPQNVEQFAPALFAAHAASLGLQAALRLGDHEAEREGAVKRAPPTSLQYLPQRLRQAGAVLRHPGSWPIMAKMGLAMVLASLLPMTIIAFYNWQGSTAALAGSEMRNLERIAQSSAGHVSQLINDSRSLANFLGSDPDFSDLLQAPSAAGRASVQGKLDSLVKSIPDVYPIFLLDAQGNAVVSSDPGVTGRNFAFREYFRTAMSGQPFMTGMVVGSTAGAPGVYYSHPVIGKDGRVLGVVALRIKGTTIAGILDESTRGTGRKPFLIDGDGVLIYYPDSAKLYSSLVPLPADKLRAIVADQRFRKDHIESLNMPGLAKAIAGATQSGTIAYQSSLSGSEEIAGFAPLGAHNWVLGITESRMLFEAPVNQLFEHVLYSVLVVGLLFLVLALLFARSIVKPIERLTHAANALKRGDYEEANIKVTSGDEIGRLARTFNVMIDVLRQRDRERQRTQNIR